MIDVLWIDDQPTEAFIDNAFTNDLFVDSAKNADEGIKILLNSDKHYDAVILDANCLQHEDDKPGDEDVSALGYILKLFAKNHIEIPWFVYSGGNFRGKESIDVLIRANHEDYNSDNKWYRKGDREDEHRMFEDIKKVVSEYDIYKLKHKYECVTRVYPRQEQILSILRFLDKEPMVKETAYNAIRKEIEYIFAACHEKGIIQQEFEGPALTDNSKYLGQPELRFVVPQCIQELIRKLVRICNPESHYMREEEVLKLDYNMAPFLENTTIYDFLNVVLWYNGIYTKTERELIKLKTDVAYALKDVGCIVADTSKLEKSEYEGTSKIVEKDKNGTFHCGECLVPKEIVEKYKLEGVMVELQDVKQNTRKNSKEKIYPYYAHIHIKK